MCPKQLGKRPNHCPAGVFLMMDKLYIVQIVHYQLVLFLIIHMSLHFALLQLYTIN